MPGKLEIVVVGAGAVGSYFGAQLAKSGRARLTFICRSDYAAVSGGGYHISSPKGDEDFMPDAVLSSVEEYRGQADYILVASKVLPEADVPTMIAPLIHPASAIVLLQNGIEIEPPVAAAFPGIELISGIAYVGVTRTAPGKIVHTDGGRLKFGNYPSGLSEKTLKLARLFNAVGIPTETYSDIQRVRWEKLVWNAAFNPVSVLTLSDTRRILECPETLALIRAVMEEVSAVAAAAGWPQRSDICDAMIEYTRGFRPYKPSMLADFESGRSMETGAILGNFLARARSLGQSVPHSAAIHALITLLASRG